MAISWDHPLQNGFEAFFTEDTYNKHTKVESFEERYLNNIEKWEGLSSGNILRQNASKQTNKPQSFVESITKFDPPSEVPPEVCGDKDKQTRKSKDDGQSVSKQTIANQQSGPARRAAFVAKARVPPPRYSSLKHEEHKQYLRLYQKYYMTKPVNPTEEEIADLNKLSNLQKLLTKEQQEHQVYAKALAEAQITSYKYMDTDAKRYIEDKLRVRKKEIELYPAHYNTIGQFFLQGEGLIPQLTHVKLLLDMGNVPRMVVPAVSLSNRQTMKLDVSAIEEQYPTSSVKNSSSEWKHEACSMDSNAEYLAQLHQAHIVISPGALKCLVDNHAPQFSRHWDIPVTVRHHDIKVGDKMIQHRTVYVDRPIIAKKINEREKNTTFYKYALKKQLRKSEKINSAGQGQNEAHHEEITPKSNSNKQSVRTEFVESGIFDAVSSQMTDLEIFGTSSTGKSPTIRSKKPVYGSKENDDLFGGQSMANLESFGTESFTSLSSNTFKSSFESQSSIWKKPSRIESKCNIDVPSVKKEVTAQESCSSVLTKSLSQDSQGFEPVLDPEDTRCDSFDNKPDKNDASAPEMYENSGYEPELSIADDQGEGQVSEEGVVTKEIYEKDVSAFVAVDSQGLNSDDLESPASPAESPSSPCDEQQAVNPDIDTPESPTNEIESPLSPTEFDVDETSRSPNNLKLKINSVDSSVSPRSRSLVSPFSPEKSVSLLCSPDTRPCKIIPLEGENETEIVIDKSQCVPSAVSFELKPKRKLRKSSTSMPELGVRPKKKRLVPKTEVKTSDLDTDDENLIIDWSSQDDVSGAMDTDNPKTGVNKKSRRNEIQNVMYEVTVCNENEVPLTPTHNEINTKDKKHLTSPKTELSKLIISPDTGLDTQIMEIEMTSDQGESSSDCVVPNKPTKRLLRSNSQVSENKDNSNDTSEEKRITRSRGQVSSEKPDKRRRLRSRSDGSEVRVQEGESVHGDKTDSKSEDSQSVCSEEMVVTRKRGRRRISVTEDASNSIPDKDGGEMTEDVFKMTHSSKTENKIGPDEAEKLVHRRRSSRKSATDETAAAVETKSQSEQPSEETGVGPQLTVDDPSPPKRRRGRPPKIKKEQSEDHKVAVNSDDVFDVDKETEPEVTECEDRLNSLPSAVDPKASVVLRKEMTMSKGNKAKRQKERKSTTGVSTLDVIMQMQEKMLHVPNPGSSGTNDFPMSLETESKTDFCFKKPHHHDNVSYHLWSLGQFQLIIRSGCHGIIKDSLQQLSSIYICPKMEYQSNIGLEQLTSSEISRSWISAYIRQNCRLLRARIDPVKSELMSMEQVNPSQMVSATQVFNPGNALLMLQNIFHKLHQLQPGQYLLSHSRGSQECEIRKSTDNNKRGTYDLHFQHFGFMATVQGKDQVPWIPVDPGIIMPHHIKFGRIPATFQPKDFSYKQQHTQNTKQKKKRKKKNKK